MCSNAVPQNVNEELAAYALNIAGSTIKFLLTLLEK